MKSNLISNTPIDWVTTNKVGQNLIFNSCLKTTSNKPVLEFDKKDQGIINRMIEYFVITQEQRLQIKIKFIHMTQKTVKYLKYRSEFSLYFLKLKHTLLLLKH